jgi:hypothetical protein
MKSIIRILLATTCVLSLIGATAACGVDPCETLSDRCANCANETDKVNCEVVVAFDQTEGCQNALDDATIAESCPE